MQSIVRGARPVFSSLNLKRALIAAPAAFYLCRQISVSSWITSQNQSLSQNQTMASQATQEIPNDVVPNANTAGPANTTLPPLSPADFRAYNRMADMMEMFHNNFRMTWQTMAAACSESNPASQSMSASRLINTGLSFVHHLEVHHSIEEAHVFPFLAQRMPMFKADALVGPLEQHRQIHAGMDKLEAYLNECKSGERSLRRKEVKDIMDTFGPVLWTHLAEEVEHLGAQSMRQYWTKEEIARMPM